MLEQELVAGLTMRCGLVKKSPMPPFLKMCIRIHSFKVITPNIPKRYGIKKPQSRGLMVAFLFGCL
jgi:hypothetical protein